MIPVASDVHKGRCWMAMVPPPDCARAAKVGRCAVGREVSGLADALLEGGFGIRQGEGIRFETLFRDETVGALDATNSKQYVRMLRRDSR